MQVVAFIVKTSNSNLLKQKEADDWGLENERLWAAGRAKCKSGKTPGKERVQHWSDVRRSLGVTDHSRQHWIHMGGILDPGKHFSQVHATRRVGSAPEVPSLGVTFCSLQVPSEPLLQS